MHWKELHLSRIDKVVIIVVAILLAFFIYLAMQSPFVKELMPLRFDILSIENTTTGDPVDGLPDLTIHIKNTGGKTGEELVRFDTENALFIDGIPITGYVVDPSDGFLVAGDSATITIPGGGKKLDEKFNMKLVTVDNWGIEGQFWVGWAGGIGGD